MKIPPIPAPIDPRKYRVSTPKPQATARKVGLPLDISSSAKYDELDENEKTLCSVLRLQPTVYLNIKEILVKEQAKNKHVKRSLARSIIKIDVNKTSKLYDYFLARKLISTTSTE